MQGTVLSVWDTEINQNCPNIHTAVCALKETEKREWVVSKSGLGRNTEIGAWWAADLKKAVPTGHQEFFGFPGGSDGKESACNVGDLSLMLGSGRSPGEGNGNPL